MPLPTGLGIPYVLERQLGRGGMATVYLARDIKHDRRVAVKVLNAELTARVGAERFVQEIRLTARLQHPHVLGLLDSGVFGPEAAWLAGRPYYVMPYVEGESLLMGISDVAVSSGSACTSSSLEPSYVLKALGAGDDLAHSSIRFGLGRWTTEEEVDYVADKLTNVVTRLREMSPLYELAKEGVDLSTMQWEVH